MGGLTANGCFSRSERRLRRRLRGGASGGSSETHPKIAMVAGARIVRRELAG
jgi:hypothetical protein